MASGIQPNEMKVQRGSHQIFLLQLELTKKFLYTNLVSHINLAYNRAWKNITSEKKSVKVKNCRLSHISCGS